jgi:uncharacterized iron-regulated membrane protein
LLRKTLFWCHLAAGTVAGLVIFTMCVTGVLLMYERQILAWAQRDLRSAPPAHGSMPPSPEALLTNLERREQTLPATLTLQANPAAPAEAAFAGRLVYLDAYSGEALGAGATAVRSFFRAVTDVHRWLAMQGEQRPAGRAVTGAANLIFLFIALTGMYLWLPRKWGWRNVRPVVFFRSGVTGKARDFNWHNAIGIWCAAPLIFIVLGALVISYPWATNLLYRLTGSEAPAATAAPASPPRNSEQPFESRLTGLDQAFERARQHVPAWKTAILRIPASNRNSVEVVIAESHRGRPDKRSTLTIDRATGAVMKAETFSSYNLGRRLRLWLRFVHTGEALGPAGQTVAGIVSAGRRGSRVDGPQPGMATVS